jgi:zinc protease
VREFYRRWYSPNNATLIVVGDVDPDEVFALTEQYFGRISPRPLPVRKPQDEPPQLGIKRLTVKAPAELPYAMMAYRVPALHDPDKEWEPFALEMLENVLSGSEAGRLNRALVREKRIATNAYASYDSIGRGPGMFYLFGSPIRGVTAAALEEALRGELKKIVEQGVSEEELNRVKAQAVAAHVFERDSMYFQARMIGQLEMSGISHKTVDLQLKKLREVTAAQVQEVARKYLVDDQLTVAYLEPQPVEGRKPAAPPAGLLHAQ